MSEASCGWEGFSCHLQVYCKKNKPNGDIPPTVKCRAVHPICATAFCPCRFLTQIKEAWLTSSFPQTKIQTSQELRLQSLCTVCWLPGLEKLPCYHCSCNIFTSHIPWPLRGRPSYCIFASYGIFSTCGYVTNHSKLLVDSVPNLIMMQATS